MQSLQYADLTQAVVDPMLTRGQRIASFMEQVGDPYHLRVGKILVALCFDESQPSLEQKLAEHLRCNRLSL